MKILVVFFVLCVNVLCVVGEYNGDYKGYKVYNVELRTEQHQRQFNLLKNDAVDFWRKPSVKHSVVGQAMVSPSHMEWFEEKLEELGIEKDIAIEDVFEYLLQKDTGVSRTAGNDTQIEFDFNGYYRYNEVLNHIYRLEESFTNSTTTSFEVIEFGRTEENRPLVYMKLTNINNATNITKPVIVIESGIVPREWITIPSALYVLDRILNETMFLDDYEWVIIPVLNPDGYEYTHTNLRLWTKSRSTNSNLGFICPGVHINRNFNIDWSSFDSSSSPCSHLFAGVSPFSEIESQFIRSIIKEFESRLRLYISFQNTGGFISYPWHYERAASGMFRQHLLLGLDMVAAMKDEYALDFSAEASGDRASGTSTDYARNETVLYTFNLDVVPRGNEGVFVPKEEIVDIAEDVWRAVSIAARVEELRNMNPYFGGHMKVPSDPNDGIKSTRNTLKKPSYMQKFVHRLDRQF